MPLRLLDWHEVYEDFSARNAARAGEPLHELRHPVLPQRLPAGQPDPDWNDLVHSDRWRDAIERLHATNNFPEFTGRLCPAPCEAACVLGINQDPVTIKQVEVEIIDSAFDEGWVKPLPPEQRDRQEVAVVGSGPAGLAAAQQLTRAGHAVTVFERDDRIGGLLRYGIPDFKMEKRHIDRRLEQMEAEGTEFRAGVNVGVDITADAAARRVRRRSCSPAARRQRATCRSRAASSTASTRRWSSCRGQPGAAGRPGADDDACRRSRRGQARHHHRRRRHRRRLPGHGPPPGRGQRPPVRDHAAPAGDPRGLDPVADLAAHVPGLLGARGGRRAALLGQHRASSSARRRQGHRRCAATRSSMNGAAVREGRGHRARAGGRPGAAGDGLRRPGARGPARPTSASSSTDRGNVARDADLATTVPGVFVAGDMGRGQSLIVWAIAEGRAAAAGVDRYLMGRTALPHRSNPRRPRSARAAPAAT